MWVVSVRTVNKNHNLKIMIITSRASHFLSTSSTSRVPELLTSYLRPARQEFQSFSPLIYVHHVKSSRDSHLLSTSCTSRVPKLLTSYLRPARQEFQSISPLIYVQQVRVPEYLIAYLRPEC